MVMVGRARGQRPVLAMPMLGDVEPARDPHALARGNVVEKSRQTRGASGAARKPAVQPDRHHLGRALALGVEQVEYILEIGEEVFAGVEALGIDEAHVVGVERVRNDEVRLPSAH